MSTDLHPDGAGREHTSSVPELVPLDMARHRVLSLCEPLAVTRQPLLYSVGGVSARTVRSPHPLPMFTNSAMDGVAVRSADCSHPHRTLALVGAVMAGDGGGAIGPGESARVMTGAPLPQGADAVCPQERCEFVGSDSVVVGPAVRRGLNVRSPGEDLDAGSEIVGAGSVIDPATAALLAAVGIAEVEVVRPPVVGIVSTGDELVDGGSGLPPGAGGIFDANRVLLQAMVTGEGFGAVDLGILPDDEHAYAGLLERIDDHCDVVVSTGGASFGARDIVRSHLTTLRSGQVHAMQVAIKPGKPQVFALVNGGRTRVFGLPGNPVAAAVSFELLVRPALRKLAGHADWFRPTVVGRAGVDFVRKRDGKLHLRPVRFEAGSPPVVRAAPRHGSHILTSLRRAHGLALLPDGTGTLVGKPVRCMVLDAAALCGAATTDPSDSAPGFGRDALPGRWT